MEIVIIGTGNTATVLGKTLKAAGQHIVQVFGRHRNAAQSLAEELEADPVDDIRAIHPDAGLYILAVSDNAVEAVANSLPKIDGIVVHTAASISKEVFKGVSEKYGVFYPLQSLKKEVRQLPPLPILLDANDQETLHVLHELASTFSDSVFIAGDEKRLKMHLAAVIVNNFSNHLFALVDNYCRQEQLHFSMLLPLMKETVSRVEEISPAISQTGPAIRRDTVTIKKHLALLEQNPSLKKLYEQFTESILQSR